MVLFQKMDTEGGYLDSYNYRAGKGGWCVGRNLATDVTLSNGEAICVDNETGAKVMFRVSGEVELAPVSKKIGPGFNLIGNMTPVELNVNDIKVFQNGEEYQENNMVLFQKMDTEGGYLDSYNYRAGKGGWCLGRNLVTDVTLLPGESFCLDNETGAEIELRFKSPVNK